MKLYVVNPNNNQKIYLNVTASTRQQLVNQIGAYFFYIDNVEYHVSNVYAERESNSTVTGAVAGGMVGAFAGPVGILIGGLLGGAIGNNSDDQESNIVRRFNLSRV